MNQDGSKQCLLVIRINNLFSPTPKKKDQGVRK